MLSKDVSLNEGETAILVCVAVGQPVKVSWSFNGAPVVNNSFITIFEEDFVQGIKQSFLQICSLVGSDAGGYTCVASGGQGHETSTSSVQMTVFGMN
jgi:hypothetical protein